MSDALWTSDDPQPEDLDKALANMDGWVFEEHPVNPDVRVRLLVDLEGEDADRLSRIAVRRGESTRQALSELIRDADRSAA